MKEYCIKCGEELSFSYSTKCYDCRQKEEKRMLILATVAIVVVTALLIGGKFYWASIVFDDWRCALSECRIIKD